MTAALLLVLGPALAACGGDGDGGGTSSTPAPDRTASASAAAPADRAAAEREIRRNWERFFDPGTPLDEKKTLLENGELLGPLLEAFSGDERGGQVEARVTGVTFTSPTEADVEFALALGGATVLPDASGTAVEQDGTWKVSATSLCALVQLTGEGSGPAVPGC